MPDPTEKQVATSKEIRDAASTRLYGRGRQAEREHGATILEALADRMAAIEQDAELKIAVENALICCITGEMDTRTVERLAFALTSLFPHLATTEKPNDTRRT